MAILGVENFFCDLKEFHRIAARPNSTLTSIPTVPQNPPGTDIGATRYEKTDDSFAAMIHLVRSYLAIK